MDNIVSLVHDDRRRSIFLEKLQMQFAEEHRATLLARLLRLLGICPSLLDPTSHERR